MLSRAFYWFGLLMAVATIFVTAALILHRIQQIEAVRAGFWDNLAYTTSQADFELVRLIDTLTRSENPDDPIMTDEIGIRFEVALSRLSGMTEGLTGERIMANAEVRGTILSVIKALEAREFDILTYPTLAAVEQADIKNFLRDLSEEFHGATVKIASLGDRDQTDFYISLTSSATTEILLLGLILVSLLIASGNALLERRRYTNLNQSLSGRVAERTAELEMANAQLEAEVVERTQANQRFQTLVEHASEAIVICDVEEAGSVFLDINPRAEVLFGLSADQLSGTLGILDFSPEVQPDGRPSAKAVAEHLKNAANGELQSFDWVLQNAEGRQIPCEVSLARLPHPSRRLVRGNIIDLTERHEAELAKRHLEAKLAQAQRLETIGQMTGGVAHDFNNLLSVIVGNLELLEEKSRDAEDKELIEAAIAASMKGASLVRSMLSFARRAHLHPERLAPADLVRTAKNWVARTIPATIRLEMFVEPDTRQIWADAAGAESAFLNLVINARDALPSGGTITIEIRNVAIERNADAEGLEELERGHYVLLSVHDTGEGIPADVLPHVFDPFFTTKSKSMNSGLGLSMVHGFMRQSGGVVRVRSAIGAGTTVELYFPAADPEDAAAAEPDGLVAPKRDVPGRILLAEDQDEVRRVVERQLVLEGYTVVSARSGDDAAEIFKKSGPFDLLLTDIVMPGILQGGDLARHLREEDPDLPVVFMTGYADARAVLNDSCEPEEFWLTKPVPRGALLGAIHSALEQRGSNDD